MPGDPSLQDENMPRTVQLQSVALVFVVQRGDFGHDDLHNRLNTDTCDNRIRSMCRAQYDAFRTSIGHVVK
jgi:hypothetical protein